MLLEQKGDVRGGIYEEPNIRLYYILSICNSGVRIFLEVCFGFSLRVLDTCAVSWFGPGS